MNKEMTKISVNKFESLLSSDDCHSVTIHGKEDIEVMVRNNVSLTEMIMIVTDIAETCVDVEHGEYMPQLFDFILRSNILSYYAGFSMPKNVDKQYRLVYETNAFDTVIGFVNQKQVRAIVDAAKKKIQFLLNVITSTTAMKMDDVVSSLEEISQQMQKVFSDIDPESFPEMLEKLIELGKITEKDLAHAVAANQLETAADG